MASKRRQVAAKPDDEMPELTKERLKTLRPMSELLVAKGGGDRAARGSNSRKSR